MRERLIFLAALVAASLVSALLFVPRFRAESGAGVAASSAPAPPSVEPPAPPSVGAPAPPFIERPGFDDPLQPVVGLTWDDAVALATWLRARLPTEAEWERAARGDQSGEQPRTAWAYDSNGKPKANTWQGSFPLRDEADDGFSGLAPVGCFAPNALGLSDMIGNAWEWTTEPSPAASRVVKGGSFLCSLDYCANFRPAGRQAQEADLPTSHIGFRTIAPA